MVREEGVDVPFMESAVTRKPAGKIDLVVASDRTKLQWCGMEMQAVYFSGPGRRVRSTGAPATRLAVLDHGAHNAPSCG